MSAAREPVLEIDGLTVRYGEQVAVDEATLTVRRGELFGFIGPNGAGKSTTMRVLATVQRAPAGCVRVLGRDVALDPEWVRWRLGYMPDLFGMPDALSVREYLELEADVHALAPGSRSAAIDAVLELTDLTEHRAKATGALSKGMRQRLYLAKTLLPEPEVLILDEPASGLDPRARIELRALLQELHAMGKTILISSHVLSELSEICDSVGIIEAGRILAQGGVEEILARVQPHLEVRVEPLGDPAPVLAALEKEALVAEPRLRGARIELAFQGGREELAGLLARLVGEGHAICSFEARRGDMEDVFLQVTKGIVS